MQHSSQLEGTKSNLEKWKEANTLISTKSRPVQGSEIDWFKRNRKHKEETNSNRIQESKRAFNSFRKQFLNILQIFVPLVIVVGPFALCSKSSCKSEESMTYGSDLKTENSCNLSQNFDSNGKNLECGHKGKKGYKSKEENAWSSFHILKSNHEPTIM